MQGTVRLLSEPRRRVPRADRRAVKAALNLVGPHDARGVTLFRIPTEVDVTNAAIHVCCANRPRQSSWMSSKRCSRVSEKLYRIPSQKTALERPREVSACDAKLVESTVADLVFPHLGSLAPSAGPGSLGSPRDSPEVFDQRACRQRTIRTKGRRVHAECPSWTSAMARDELILDSSLGVTEGWDEARSSHVLDRLPGSLELAARSPPRG